MKHIDGLGKLGHIEYPVFDPCSNSDLSHAVTNVIHRFPIVRITSLLNPAELKADDPACISGKSFHIVTCGSEPENRFVRHVSICKYSYILSSAHTRPSPNKPLQTDDRRAAMVAE